MNINGCISMEEEQKTILELKGRVEALEAEIKILKSVSSNPDVIQRYYSLSSFQIKGISRGPPLTEFPFYHTSTPTYTEINVNSDLPPFAVEANYTYTLDAASPQRYRNIYNWEGGNIELTIAFRGPVLDFALNLNNRMKCYAIRNWEGISVYVYSKEADKQVRLGEKELGVDFSFEGPKINKKI